MKYQISNEIIQQDNRKDINEKILYIINNNLLEKYNISNEDIFNSYTGDGGLSNLSYNDYTSYYEYSNAKKEIENAQFLTSANIAKFLLDCIKPNKNDLICDLTSGTSVFCNFVPNEYNFYGNEIDVKAHTIAKLLYPNANLTQGNIKYYNPNILFDLIVGNPPYNLRIIVDNIEYLSQFYYCIKAADLLKPSGVMAIIVPDSFLKDEFSNKKQIEEISNKFNFICQFDLPDNSFKNVGVEKFNTKILILQKKSEYINDKKYETIKDVKAFNLGANYIYNKYIIPAIKEKETVRTKLLLELVKNHTDDFTYKLKKYMYDIQRNPKIKQYYDKCQHYVQQFYSQSKPYNISEDEWDKIKITPNKVLAYLKNILNNINKNERDIVKLVKTSKEIRYKAYSRKTKLELSKSKSKNYSINELVYNKKLDIVPEYKKLIKKHIHKFEQQNIDFDKIKINKDINNFINNNKLYQSTTGEYIEFTKPQKEIVNKMLQKHYGYIQAEQGSGKTLMSLIMSEYRIQNNLVNKILVVAPSIAINGTWIDSLEDFGYNNYIVLNNISDIYKLYYNDNIKFVLITFNMLTKFNKILKKYLKTINYKIFTILDEADNICNLNTKRYKSAISTTFKSKYKLAMSGTMDRNNITESFSQFEWLYGQSYNYICDCKESYQSIKTSKKKNKNENCNVDLKLGETEYTLIKNTFYLQPFPRYKKGETLFKNCFNPEKITVFGISKNTQDIYNKEQLRKLISKTIITKSFEEITGKKKPIPNQITVKFNEAEKFLYSVVINKFHEMKYLFDSTGNIRKDRMLDAIRQLNLLLDTCKTPHLYKEYNSTELPTKIQKIYDMIKDSNERISIGVRTINELETYSNLISNTLPNRKLVVVSGKVTLQKRIKLIKELKSYDNCILLATQQSLSSSLNIGFIDNIIATSLPYNWATFTQWYSRFIRFDSNVENKKINIITYENSIESNLLNLLMCKEKLVLFMKNEEMDDEELFDKFGISFNLLNMLLSKHKDTEGKMRIEWGNSNL